MTEEPDEVTTIKQARDLSLIKWRKVETLMLELFLEINHSCGFCMLGQFLAEKKLGNECCDKCGVEPRCGKIQETSQEIGDALDELVMSTIQFLEKMEVADN